MVVENKVSDFAAAAGLRVKEELWVAVDEVEQDRMNLERGRTGIQVADSKHSSIANRVLESSENDLLIRWKFVTLKLDNLYPNIIKK